ncbi:MAG: prolipoprotein diacylglyceryl transferase [Pirellulaceae bacterium]|nr:prolipoprotein diacylglyceryl transferase [Pirellulaceae bacterium]
MLKTLYTIPHEILGLPLFGLGWLAILWLVGGLLFFGFLYKAEGTFSANAKGHLPLYFLILAIILFLLPNLEEPIIRSENGQALGGGGLAIRGYGFMMLLAVLSGVGLALWRGKKAGLLPETIFSSSLWMVVGGIVGGRLFYTLQYFEGFLRYEQNSLDIRATIFAFLNVSQGGLVVYGAAIGAILALAIFCSREKIRLLKILDVIAPSLFVGLALGRIGCLLNGCCFGGYCENPTLGFHFPEGSPPYIRQLEEGAFEGFLLTTAKTEDGVDLVVGEVYPGMIAEENRLMKGTILREINDAQFPEKNRLTQEEILIQGRKELTRFTTLRLRDDQGNRYQWVRPERPTESLPVHPTQLYSAGAAFALAFILIVYTPFRLAEGAVFALGMTIYPVIRILLEIVRTDEPGFAGSLLTVSQWVSVILFLATLSLWGYLFSKWRQSQSG